MPVLDKVIGKVTWSPEHPQVGDSVKFEVCDADGKPYANGESALISIDGVPGSEQYRQFFAPGKQTVMVTASTPQGPEQQQVEITVGEAPKITRRPRKGPVPLYAEPHFLMLGSVPETTYGAQFSLLPASSFLRPASGPAKEAPPAVSGEQLKAPVQQRAKAGATYAWDFGDGSPVVHTRSAVVNHDYEPALDPARVINQFHVTVGVTISPKEPPLTYRRTLAVVNGYAATRARGVIVPPVSSDGYARKVGQSFVGTASVQNLEPYELVLKSQVVIPILADSTKTTVAGAATALPSPVSIPAHGNADMQVSVPFDVVPEDALGFTVVFSQLGGKAGPAPVEVRLLPPSASPRLLRKGTTLRKLAPGHVAPGGPPANVRASAHFLVQPSDRLSNASRVGAISIGKLTTGKGGQLERVIGKTTLSTLNGLRTLPKPVGRGGLGKTRIHPAPPPPPAPPSVGQVCDPDNLPEGVPAGFACQMTTDTQVVATPALFMNARKGDLVLVPGDSMIGQLLRQLEPAQYYSHSGIMTRNHDQITHCTSSDKRPQNFPVGSDGQPTDGFDPDVIRYGWPGVITQSIDEATSTTWPHDPVTGLPIEMGPSFATVPASLGAPGQPFVIVPPLVVKPDPFAETDAVRAQLAKVADEAAAQVGKAHYRFYCYTKPEIGEDPAYLAPASAGWAAGTFPAVCSSFIWLMMKKAGLECVGPQAIATNAELGTTATLEGAQVASDTLDGLFYYTEQERENAALWLYNYLYTLAYQQTGALGELFTEAADQIANQLCNAFANDDCSASNEDTAWQQPGYGNAVSPENLTWWNGPDRGGIYGYSEPLIFRGATRDVVPVYRWAQVTQYGTVAGRVMLDGQPVGGATVQLDSDSIAISAPDGTYRLDHVAYGSYRLSAQKVDSFGEFLSATVPITVAAASESQDIALLTPDQDYRQMVISGNIHLVCTKNEVLWTDTTPSDTPFEIVLDVGPYGTHASGKTGGIADSAFLNATFTADWQADRSVNVGWEIALDGDVLLSAAPGAVTESVVAADGTEWWEWDLSGHNDTAKVTYTIQNNVWQR